MQRIVATMILAGLMLAPSMGAAYSSNICQNPKCSQAEVGVFMKDISQVCGNSGTCSLEDIMIVFGNVAEFILSIIGGLVLLMYIVGGVLMISAGGSADRVARGKKFLRFSTVGLLIVVFAYLGISSLKSALLTGDVTTEYIIDCTGVSNASSPTDATTCGNNMICHEGICMTTCAVYTPGYSCINKSIIDANSSDYDSAGTAGCPNTNPPSSDPSTCAKLKTSAPSPLPTAGP